MTAQRIIPFQSIARTGARLEDPELQESLERVTIESGEATLDEGWTCSELEARIALLDLRDGFEKPGDVEVLRRAPYRKAWAIVRELERKLDPPVDPDQGVLFPMGVSA